MTPIGSSSTSKPPPVSARFQWKHLPSTLNHLTNLKALRLWLDHDKTSNWYVFNERLLREPFLDSLSLPQSPTSLCPRPSKTTPKIQKSIAALPQQQTPRPEQSFTPCLVPKRALLRQPSHWPCQRHSSSLTVLENLWLEEEFEREIWRTSAYLERELREYIAFDGAMHAVPSDLTPESYGGAVSCDRMRRTEVYVNNLVVPFQFSSAILYVTHYRSWVDTVSKYKYSPFQ
jgi:hypothetical protein